MQKIANVRIDVRLIHGQVAAMWVNTLGITRIMVVDTPSTKDNILKMALKLACPPNVKLSVLTPEKAANNLLENKYNGDAIMIVAKGPESLLDLYKAGFKLETINVGNMASAHDTKMIKKSIHVSQKDISNFKELASLGVKFTAQMYPNEDYFDFLAALDK